MRSSCCNKASCRWHDPFTCVTGVIHVCDMSPSYVTWLKARCCNEALLLMTWPIHTCDIIMWLIHVCDMSHSYVCHDPFTHVTGVIRMCGVLRLYVWHDPFIRAISSCNIAPSQVWHDSFTFVTWLIHWCDRSYSYVLHESFTCVTFVIPRDCHRVLWSYVTWLIHMCGMTHLHFWHGSFTCVTWLIHMCDITHSHVWHDLFICVIWLIPLCCNRVLWSVSWLIHTCGSNACYHQYQKKPTKETGMNEKRPTNEYIRRDVQKRHI